jgi:hypothetical protein
VTMRKRGIDQVEEHTANICRPLLVMLMISLLVPPATCASIGNSVHDVAFEAKMRENRTASRDGDHISDHTLSFEKRRVVFLREWRR